MGFLYIKKKIKQNVIVLKCKTARNFFKYNKLILNSQCCLLLSIIDRRWSLAIFINKWSLAIFINKLAYFTVFENNNLTVKKTI